MTVLLLRTKNPRSWKISQSGAKIRWFVTLADIQARNPFTISVMEGAKWFRLPLSPDNPPRPEQLRGYKERTPELGPPPKPETRNISFLLLLQDTQHQMELCGQELCPGQKLG